MKILDRTATINEFTDFREGTVILIDKALDWTSFDVVNKIRFQLRRFHNLKKIKVGHNGTLDPLATGLLMIFTGKYTKLIPTEENHDKTYLAEIKFGATTASLDRETEEIDHMPFDHIDFETINTTLERFLGEQEQLIPMYSATKHKGVAMYKLARAGKPNLEKKKTVVFHSFELLEYEGGKAQIRIKCGKGTYIRAFARDLGEALGTKAYLTGLARTKIAEYTVEDALSVEEFCNKLAEIEYCTE